MCGGHIGQFLNLLLESPAPPILCKALLSVAAGMPIAVVGTSRCPRTGSLAATTKPPPLARNSHYTEHSRVTLADESSQGGCGTSMCPVARSTRPSPTPQPILQVRAAFLPSCPKPCTRFRLLVPSSCESRMLGCHVWHPHMNAFNVAFPHQVASAQAVFPVAPILSQ
jgi:hypothetical protein